MGGLEDAIQIAAHQAGIEKYNLVEYPVIKSPFEELITELTGSIKTQIMQEELGSFYYTWQQIKNILNNQGLMAASLTTSSLIKDFNPPNTTAMAYTKILLLPLSIIYGIITGTRNFLFHIGVLKSKSFTVPVLCVGNITVGGTGKTPHTELLIAELKKKFRVACLSRGYKRKTSGFILSDNLSTAREIGMNLPKSNINIQTY